MKKPSVLTVVIICIATLIIGAFVYVVLTSAQPSKPADSGQSQPEPEPATPTQTEATKQVPGAYLDYSESAFASSQTERRLLFFHAGWCPQCRMLEKSIQQSGVPNNTAIFKVDYDTATGLRQKYGVTIQTTVVEVDKNGNLIRKHVAYDNPSLPAVLNALQ